MRKTSHAEQFGSYTSAITIALTALLILAIGDLPSLQAVELSVSDFSFDGQLGSDGATIQQLGPNHFRMNLARAPGHPEWTNMCQFTIQGNAAGNTLQLECAGGLRQFGSWSYDMQNWRPIQRTTVDGTSMLAFPEFTQDTVYFGGEAPMSYEQMVDMTTQWDEHDHVSVKQIGTSMQGRPILRVSVADPDGPYPMETRWSHHAVNQHCYEYNSQWRIAGMVDWLLSEEGAECRQRSVNHFVVMMNVDGPHNGYARVNQQGIDLNRAYSVSGWADNPARESQAVQKDLEALDQQTPITTTWSMHTWEGDQMEPMLRPGPEMGTTVGPWTELRDIIENNDTVGNIKPLYALTSAPSPTHWTSGTHLQLGVSAFCAEGAALVLTKEENLQTGRVLMKSLDQFYGVPPAAVTGGSSNYYDVLSGTNPLVYFRLNEPGGQAVGAALVNQGSPTAAPDATWGLPGYANTAPRSGIPGLNPSASIGGKALVGLENNNTVAQFTGLAVPDADMFELGNPTALDLDRVSCSFWFNTTVGGTWGRILCTHPDFENDFYIIMHEGRLYLTTNGVSVGGVDNVAETLEDTFNDGLWHHAVAIRDGDDAADARLFIDGKAISLNSRPGGPFDDGFSYRFGCKGTSSLVWTGSLDEIAIWDRTLSNAEVESLFAAAFVTGPIPGDANSDGVVNDADAAILSDNWQRSGDATWADGDFNGDGKVDTADATLLAANWQSATTSATADVPEPSWTVLLLGSMTLLMFQNAR